jgi:hypothetical protein
MAKTLCLFIVMTVLFSCAKKGSAEAPEEKQMSNGQREAEENIPADTGSDADAMFPVWETSEQRGREEIKGEKYVYTPLEDADVYAATITKDGVDLRTMPNVIGDFRSDVIKTLSAGDRVAIQGRSDKKYTVSIDEAGAGYWYKVLTEDGESGYVFGGNLAGIDERRYGAVMEELKKRTEALGPLFVDDFSQSLVYLDIASMEKTKDWPLEIRLMVLRLHLVDFSLKTLPDLSSFPSIQNLTVTMPALEDIRSLRDSKALKYIYLNNTAISDAGILSTCINLQEISLAGSKITGIPDLSRLKNLDWLYLDRTPIRSLRGIETLPQRGLKLSVRECDLLEDLDPLLDTSNVEQIVFDEKNYERLKPWHDENLSKIEASRGGTYFGFGLSFIE